ncbi:hypothetical protein ACE6H2_011308 [Prunus campanulata]
MDNLSLLYLFKNELTGTVPQEVGNLQSLNQLQLQFNNLTGPIPASIGNLAAWMEPAPCASHIEPNLSTTIFLMAKPATFGRWVSGAIS